MAIRLRRAAFQQGFTVNTMATTPVKHDVEEAEPAPGDLPVEPEMDIGIAPDADEEEAGHPPE